MSNLQLKRELSSQELGILASEMDKAKKSKGVAYALWWFTGIIGGHRYYIGDIGYAIGMTLTLGGFGFWAVVDAFLIGGRIDTKANEEERKLIAELGLGKE